MKTAYEKDMEDTLRQIAKAVGMNPHSPNPEGLIQKVKELSKEHDDCVCKGNWRSLVSEYRDLIGRQYKAHDGVVCTFFGLVDGVDDYYYGMVPVEGGQPRLLSCVGSPEGFGYSLIDLKNQPEKKKKY